MAASPASPALHGAPRLPPPRSRRARGRSRRVLVPSVAPLSPSPAPPRPWPGYGAYGVVHLVNIQGPYCRTDAPPVGGNHGHHHHEHSGQSRGPRGLAPWACSVSGPGTAGGPEAAEVSVSVSAGRQSKCLRLGLRPQLCVLGATPPTDTHRDPAFSYYFSTIPRKQRTKSKGKPLDLRR